MPAARAASSREAPSSTSARASIRREAAPSRHRLASRRSSPAPSSCRVIPTVMAPPLIGYTADQPRQAPRGSERDDVSAIRAVGITPEYRRILLAKSRQGDNRKPYSALWLSLSGQKSYFRPVWRYDASRFSRIGSAPATSPTDPPRAGAHHHGRKCRAGLRPAFSQQYPSVFRER